MTIDRFAASRADDNGVRLQVWDDKGRHDMTFTHPQVVALIAELTRISEKRNRNFVGPK